MKKEKAEKQDMLAEKQALEKKLAEQVLPRVRAHARTNECTQKLWYGNALWPKARRHGAEYGADGRRHGSLMLIAV